MHSSINNANFGRFAANFASNYKFDIKKICYKDKSNFRIGRSSI